MEDDSMLLQSLFKSKNPEDPNEVPGGFLTDVNKDSLTVLYTVLIDKSIAHSKVYDRYQFERVGYFSVDPDTVPGKCACDSNRTRAAAAARAKSRSYDLISGRVVRPCAKDQWDRRCLN
ncbi:hypothetical protein Y032_0055g2543 [Ancylostoma ceylanicum]|uniref:tRNA synthetases class I (E and Q) anti-codon binding domain-containing protein n=1 Tax=Ancylostoma ceylanicum TaxID=53326 RepID=A0A016U5G5_9BILA|nr:hypothetical protein Y032_0055g2543 [Ancylostoma ceylanicum]